MSLCFYFFLFFSFFFTTSLKSKDFSCTSDLTVIFFSGKIRFSCITLTLILCCTAEDRYSAHNQHLLECVDLVAFMMRETLNFTFLSDCPDGEDTLNKFILIVPTWSMFSSVFIQQWHLYDTVCLTIATLSETKIRTFFCARVLI